MTSEVDKLRHQLAHANAGLRRLESENKRLRGALQSIVDNYPHWAAAKTAVAALEMKP